MPATVRSIFLLLFCLITIEAGVIKDDGDYKVGCVVCHPLDKDKINIHLIPHSHDDVGWLKTVDEYYYGLNTNAIGHAVAVQDIISSVVEELQINSDRRYIQVETAFFYKWWKNQNEDMRSAFKKLVENGQLEMVSGGWAMNDEACTNYQSTIDQFTIGLRKIEETVGKCGRSRVGWQIDPFGHSREHASILRQLGYDGLFFARLDHMDLLTRELNQKMDFAWKSSANLDDSVLFGSIFPINGYGSPNNFCWDILCGDDQLVSDPNSPIYNLKAKVDDFAEIMEVYSAYYPDDNKNIIITMGGDFQYQSAGFNFKNMDILIDAFKNHSKFNLLYSTPSCYMKAVNDANVSLSLKSDDFFPYSDADHNFWGGYFTSRPNVKRFERTGHNILQATKQMYALNSDRSRDKELEDLQEAMGVLQHHDAVTGTEKQAVANDYVRLLAAAIKKAEEPISDIIEDILKPETNLGLCFSSCLLTNFSICATSQNSEKFVVAVYNPLGWSATHYIRLPIEEATYVINGPDGVEDYDIIKSISTFSFVEVKGETPSLYELIFAAKDIPALGFKLYHIEKTGKTKQTTNELSSEPTVFHVDEKTHLLKNVTLNGITLSISQNFFYYVSSSGLDGSEWGSASGAYIFRPTPDPIVELKSLELSRSFTGKLVEEVHQRWKDENIDVHQSIIWYKNENYLELNWLVGNINVYSNNATGKEVISRFEISDFDNKNIFYTDSNGRETIQRIKDTRSDYKYNVSMEPVASNYYPVTSKIVIKDETKDIQVAILNDRSQGGTSLKENQVELMLHRRLLFDDAKGVGENLNEVEFSKGLGMYARGSHYLIIGKANGTNENGKTTTAQERILAQQKLLQPWVGLSATNMTFKDLKASINLTYSALETELPENVNILSFEVWSNTSYLLRLENFMEKDEDPNLSTTSEVDITTLIKGIDIKTITETTLSGTVSLDEFNETPRLNWNVANSSDKTDSSYGGFEVAERVSVKNGTVSLSPMQIRTFILSTVETSGSGAASFSLFISIFALMGLYLL